MDHLGLVKQLLPVFGRRLIAALPDSGGKLFLGDSLAPEDRLRALDAFP